MDILVNGSSMSRGAGSWPYYLQESLNCNLVNLALGRSGNTYIHDSTISELSQRKYDMVLIMWATEGRIDMRVKSIDQFSDSTDTSTHQSLMNDWPSKQVHPINDQDYVQKDWIFSFNKSQNAKVDSVYNTLMPLHKLVDHAQYMESDLIKMISLQGVLKSLNIPYKFMFWWDFKKFSRFDNYYNMIDWSNIYLGTSLETIGKKNNWYHADGTHFNEHANELYAKHLAEYLLNEQK
jgi:hypothetical protein